MTYPVEPGSKQWKPGVKWLCPCTLALLLAISPLLCSCSGGAAAPDEREASSQQEEAEAAGQAIPVEDDHLSVDWYDYRYTFLESWRNRDLNPQSNVVDYGGDYVHIRVKVTRIGEDFSVCRTPLQVLLYCGGKEYRVFGKDYTKNSYLWRDYTNFPDDIGESSVYMVTMELFPYSRAFNSSFSVEQAELVLNGMDWTNLEQPLITPLARFPLIQLNTEDPAAP